ncbi:MAG: phosphotransferase family protein [Caulobacteraceae bacterium]|nr:phosphotransferase family protein [Caulobacteraceae bacterium]
MGEGIVDPSVADLVPADVFCAWADVAAPQLGDGPLSLSVLPGGTANLVCKVSRGGQTMVLRRPPRSPRPDSFKIIEREARLLAALKDSDVPHPTLQAASPGTDVLGAPFYLMAWIDGWLGHGLPVNPPPYDHQGEALHNLPFALMDGIIALSKVDYKAVGLADFGKPDGFLARQADRWKSQLDSYKAAEGYEGRDIPGLAYAGDWLRANVPEQSPAGLIHGDYSLANAMFHWGAPPRLAAMIDWELATVADPLLDLGWVLYGYRGRNDTEPPAGYFDPTPFPAREELRDYYAERTGRDVSNLAYYMILSQYKLAVIMERQVARMAAGKQPFAERTSEFVLRLARRAGSMAREAG